MPWIVSFASHPRPKAVSILRFAIVTCAFWSARVSRFQACAPLCLRSHGFLQVRSHGRRLRSRTKCLLDPGRFEVANEWLTEGEVVMELPLESGDGSLQVTRHHATSQEEPRFGISVGSSREWRVLRFKPAAGESGLFQSVAQVSSVSDGAGATTVQQRGDCLPLLYAKSVVSALLAALVAFRSTGKTDDLKSVAENLKQSPLRIFLIGLGGGTLATFLSQALPHSRVDCAELEPAVLRAASEVMGFTQSSRLQVALGDGAAIALSTAEKPRGELGDESGASGVYDAVLLDVCSAMGSIPEAFINPAGDFPQALAKGLLRDNGGILVTNVLPRFDPAPALTTFRDALSSAADQGGDCTRCTTFFLREPGRTMEGEAAPDTGNFILVHGTGGPAISSMDNLRTLLRHSASAVSEAIECPFDMEALAGGLPETWPFP